MRNAYNMLMLGGKWCLALCSISSLDVGHLMISEVLSSILHITFILVIGLQLFFLTFM
jgi:hypothetical protein